MSLTEHVSGTSGSSTEKASSSYPGHHVFIQARPRHTGPATVDRPPAPHLLSFLKSCTHSLLSKKSWLHLPAHAEEFVEIQEGRGVV